MKLRLEARKLGYVALWGCLLLPLLLLILHKSNLGIFTSFGFQLSGYTDPTPPPLPLPRLWSAAEELKNDQQGTNKDNLHFTEKQREQEMVKVAHMPRESKVTCDLSGDRSDICTMHGDIRVLGKSSVIMLVSQTHNSAQENSTWKIRPYTRKSEPSVMASIKELTVVSLSADDAEHASPLCQMNHSVPSLFFSTGGFVGNLFHDFTDVLVPLFMTSNQFRGEVQFLVSDFNAQWVDKYRPILQHLSHYPIINLDADDTVRCFPHAHVGLLSHKVLGIDPSRSPDGCSMADFRRFIRACLSLEREAVGRSLGHRWPPRLLLLLRKGSRAFTNEEEVIAMARRVGYEVVTAAPEETKNISRFAKVVNSCDVMMGVHGAGLTNMVFLPANATLIQIIPWGALKWGARYCFGEPAADIGIKYVEYEIREDESSLVELYPRDHAVFKDPMSIHKQGFSSIWWIFLNQQKVKLNVERFEEVLVEVLQSLKHEQ